MTFVNFAGNKDIVLKCAYDYFVSWRGGGDFDPFKLGIGSHCVNEHLT